MTVSFRCVLYFRTMGRFGKLQAFIPSHYLESWDSRKKQFLHRYIICNPEVSSLDIKSVGTTDLLCNSLSQSGWRSFFASIIS